MKKILKKINLINIIYKFYKINFSKYSRVNYLKYPVINNLAYPWFSKPCIDYLENIDFNKKKILEFGSGFSTIYFDRKKANVISFERNNEWIKRLKNQISEQCDLRVFEDLSKEGDLTYFKSIVNQFKSQNLKFDILVIDVFPRPLTYELFAEFINDDGFIIFDNSDWYPLFFKSLKERNDLLILDFYGEPIGEPSQTCTSIIFKRPNINFNQKAKKSMYSDNLISNEDRILKF